MLGKRTDLIQGTLDLLILKTVAHGPIHGYGIAQQILLTSREILQVQQGSLYPALQRMLKAGWLKSEMGLSAKNRPVRVFKLTAAGRKRLEEERLSFEKMFAGINRVLAVAQS